MADVHGKFCMQTPVRPLETNLSSRCQSSQIGLVSRPD